jgi:hypothetical protein
MKWKLEMEINPEHLAALEQALDLYSRLCCGQIRELGYVLSTWAPGTKCHDAELTAEALCLVKTLFFNGLRDESQKFQFLEQLRGLIDKVEVRPLHPNASYGIRNEMAGSKSHVMYDLQQVLRHERAKLVQAGHRRNGNHVAAEWIDMTVDMDKPWATSEKVPLAIVKLTEIEGENQ